MLGAQKESIVSICPRAVGSRWLAAPLHAPLAFFLGLPTAAGAAGRLCGAGWSGV